MPADVKEIYRLFFERTCAALNLELAQAEEHRAGIELSIAESTASYLKDFAIRLDTATQETFAGVEAEEARRASEDARFEEDTKAALAQARMHQTKLAAVRLTRADKALAAATEKMRDTDRKDLLAFIGRVFPSADPGQLAAK
jgi:hypothetical protein